MLARPSMNIRNPSRMSNMTRLSRFDDGRSRDVLLGGWYAAGTSEKLPDET